MTTPGRGTLRRSTRLIADTLIGYSMVAAGMVMLLTPGPGILAIVAGLAILARHYHFADRLKRITISRITDASIRLRARRASLNLADPADVDTPAGTGTGGDYEAA